MPAWLVPAVDAAQWSTGSTRVADPRLRIDSPLELKSRVDLPTRDLLFGR
jgi:hypothetical protein